MIKVSDLPCLILCGGQGTRLREVVPNKPKALAEVNGRPFIVNLFEQLSNFGIVKVVLCTGFKGDQIKEAIGDGYDNLVIDYSFEEATLGTAGAIKAAIDRVFGETLLVINGDSYVGYDLGRFLSQHQTTRSNFSMVLAQISDAQRYGVVGMDKHKRVTRFLEKSGHVSNAPSLINAGTYLISRECIESFSGERPLSLEMNVIPSFVGDGLHGFVAEGGFIDIGTPGSFAEAGAFFDALGGIG
tara:strand:- start:826 stop:1554 length:729 start_codon:yes stop_codon:yes gene_type:complete